MRTRVAQAVLLALLLSSCATPQDRAPVVDAEKPRQAFACSSVRCAEHGPRENGKPRTKDFRRRRQSEGLFFLPSTTHLACLRQQRHISIPNSQHGRH